MEFINLKSGKTVEGADIEAYRSDIKGSRYVYLLAGVHGDEIEGVYLVKELLSSLENDSEIEIPLIIIPILNVDGYRSATRSNAHGVDLNRNLPTENWTKEFHNKLYNPGPSPLSEPENEYLLSLLDKYPPYFVISFHSGKSHLSFTGKCQAVADFISKQNNYPIINEEKRDFAGSLEILVPLKFKAPVLTMVAPKIRSDKSLKEIWGENREILVEILRNGLIHPENNLIGPS